MIHVARALLLVAFVAWALCGCRTPSTNGPRHVSRPELDAAADAVWEVYGVRDRARPAVRWIAPEALDCAEGRGWVDQAGRCVSGLWLHDEWTAVVAAPTGVHVADTGLAHEFCHALTEWRGVTDPGHAICYQGGGIVSQAQAVLRERF